jgi:hypothetical protein
VRAAGWAFLVLGLLLGAGGAAWYYLKVERPERWPRAAAVVVSSRVVNPGPPSLHRPELVLRYRAGGVERTATVRAPGAPAPTTW